MPAVKRCSMPWLRWGLVWMMTAVGCLSWLGARAAPAGGTAAPWPSILLAPVTTETDRPIFVTHAGDGSGRLFIAERAGRVRIWQQGALGDFVSGRIFGLRRDGATWASHTFLKSDLRIASFGEDEAGNLYVADLAGGVYRIVAPTHTLHLPLIAAR